MVEVLVTTAPAEGGHARPRAHVPLFNPHKTLWTQFHSAHFPGEQMQTPITEVPAKDTLSARAPQLPCLWDLACGLLLFGVSPGQFLGAHPVCPALGCLQCLHAQGLGQGTQGRHAVSGSCLHTQALSQGTRHSEGTGLPTGPLPV